MVQISGKYELTEAKNFYEFLLKIGVSEEQAKSVKDFKDVLEIKVDGNKISIVSNGPGKPINAVVGGEFDEIMPDGKEFRSTAKLNGDVLTITSKTKEGESAGYRTYSFTDSGLEVVFNIPKDGKTQSATRIYKRA